MADDAVCNASPIIILAKAGWIELLRIAAQRIVIPSVVATEIRQRGLADPGVAALSAVPWLEIVETGSNDQRATACAVDPGETAVLTWALAHPGVEAILDDLPARRRARSLGIRFRGTLGLILDAKRTGVIAAARPVVEAARDAGLYLSDSVVAEALTRVAE